MADIESNINIDIDTSDALASLRSLQRQISTFQQTMSKTGTVSSANLANMQQNLVNNINSTGQFSASIQRVATTTESFTNALEKNKLSMGQYFKYAGASTQTFGKLFRNEFDTIEKVARERVKTIQTQYIKLGRDASGAMNAIAVRPQVLDMKDLGTQTAMAAQKAQLFNQLMKQGSTDLLNFGKNTQWAGRQLMVGFTIPLGIMGAAAAKEFKAIEDQVLRLQRVYGDFTTTMADTEQMTSQIKGLADEFTKYGVAVSKTIGLAADAAAMGKTGADLVAQVAEANRLAVLGGVEQQQSLETTTSLTNAFGVATDKLAGKINFLNAVENQTVTSIQDMTEAIPIAAPVVQQLGGNIEDLTFFLTAMKEGGINANEGANALKSGLASIINPTQEAKDMLLQFNISLDDLVNRNAGNAKGMVLDLANSLNQLDPLNRAQAIEQMFGKFQFSRMSTLFQNVIKEGSQASRVLDLTKSSAAELAAMSERELAKIEASPLYKFEGAIEKFKAALAPVGEEFMKAVTPLINFGTDILNKFNEMSDGGKQFAVILTGAIAGIGPILLMTFGLIANGVANIIKGFMLVKNTLGNAGTATNVLAEQTNYMTSQQLEAAAVAASLGQVHSNLIQTFNAEAGSVRNLAAAYGQAISAQNMFSGPIVGSKGRKKMSTGGIVTGPGTGTSDSIPAMLSDGEAVIPAKAVKQNPKLVSGLIAGNIPGFASGRDPMKVAMGRLRSAPEAIRKQSVGAAWSSREAEVSAIVEALKEAGVDNAATTRNLTATHASHIDPTDTQQAMIGGKSQSIKNWNAKNLIADSGAVNAYMQRLTQGMGKSVLESFSDPKNIDQIVKKTGLTKEQIGKEITKLKAGKHPTTAIGAKVLAEVGDFDWTNRSSKSGASYQGLAASRALKAREGSDFYDPKQMAARAYDSSVDASAAKTTDSRIRSAQRVADENLDAKKKETKAVNQRVKVSEKVKEQETQVLADAQKQKRADAARRGWETRRLNAEKQATIQQEASVKAQRGGVAGRMLGGMSSGRVAGIGMAASAVGFMASGMGGPVGEIAGSLSGVTGVVSSAAMAMAMLPGPIGLVVGALTAIVGGSMLLIGAQEEQKKKMQELNDAMSVTSDQTSEMAKSLGVFSATESAGNKRKSAVSGLAAGKITDPALEEGAAFIGSEAGQVIAKEASTMLAEGLGSEQTGSRIGKKLAYAIVQGVITAEQASSIAVALGDQLKDYTITANIKGEITEIVGPNGQALSKTPSLVIGRMQEAEQGRQQKLATEAGLTSESEYGSFDYKKAQNALQVGLDQVSVNQTYLDALNTQYDIKVSQAKTQEEIAAIEQERNQALLAQQTKNTSYYNQMKAQMQAAATSGAVGLIGDTLKQNFAGQYAEGSDERTRANAAIDKAGQIEDTDLMVKVTTAMGTGDLSLGTAEALIEAASSGTDLGARITTNFDIVAASSGTVFADQLYQMLEASGYGEKDIDVAFKVMANTDVAPQAKELIDNFIASGDYESLDIVLNLMVEGDIEKIQYLKGELDKLNDFYAGGPKTAIEVNAYFNSYGFQMTQDQMDYYNQLPPDQQKTYTTAYLTVMETIDTGTSEGRERLRQWAIGKLGDKKAVGAKYGGGSTIGGKDFKWDYNAMASDMAGESAAAAAPIVVGGGAPVRDDTGGGGGASAPQEPEKPPTSFLDSIVKDLKTFSNAAQGLTENFQDSMNAIRNASTNIFSGMSQQMRSLGAGEDVIQLMTGMSKEEWDQYKDQFFNFDGSGNITGLKSDLAAIQAKLRALSMAKFVNEQQKSIAAANDQAQALTKLASLGMSYADAYKVVEDAALAAAIANAKSADEIRKIIELANQARQAQTLAQASASVANTNAATDATIAGLDALIKYNGALTDTQISAVLASEELQTMLANFSTLSNDQLKILDEALRDAEAKAALEIKIKMQTPEGMQEIFNDGFSKAMEQFSAQEQVIKIKFQALRNPFEDIISSFTDQIEDLKNTPGGLDDLEADLQRIGEQEVDINKKYEDRFKALDRIQEANAKIAQQQRSQLSLADALSMGDIAAAARAAQEMRATDAAQALVDQREALQKSQELELSQLTGQMGLTREQIETRIRDIRQQIFEIEEKQIEPAQRQLELLTRQEESETESLTVLGKTREEWENIKAEVELARVNTDKYKESVNLALGVADDLIAKWQEIEKPKKTIHTIIQETIASNDAAAAARAAAATPVATPAPAPSAPAGLSDAEIQDYARRVIRGEFGNGQARRNALGSNYQVIQDRVNRILYQGYAKGGMVSSYFANGGMTKPMFGPKGTDTVPAMLTPGEFVIKKWAVDRFGVDNLQAINSGKYNGGSVYNNNYSVSVNVKSDANANDIARTVIAQIKQVDAQRVRGNRF